MSKPDFVSTQENHYFKRKRLPTALRVLADKLEDYDKTHDLVIEEGSDLTISYCALDGNWTVGFCVNWREGELDQKK